MTAAVGAVASPFRVVEPVAKRLNKNALLVVLGLAGLTAGVAVVSVAPRRSATLGAGGSDSVAAAVPIRRQRPVLPTRSMLLAQPAVGRADSVVAPPTIAFEQRKARRPRGAVASRDIGGGSPETAYGRALVSGIVIGADRARRDTVPVAAVGDSAVGAIGPAVEAASARTRDVGAEREAFLAGARGRHGDVVTPSIEEPVTRFELEAGTVIPAELVTDVNSDLPGEVVGQVTRDVFDSRTESTVLVPKGTRLIGAYDDRVVAGQSRVLVAWTRMVFPDGRSVRLPAIEGVDARGAAGIEGSMNDHLGHVFVSAGLMSALSAGAQLSQPQLGGGAYAAPSAGQVAAGAMGQQLSTVGLEMARRGLDVKPTITVRGGTAVGVLLTEDLVFTRGYVDERR